MKSPLFHKKASDAASASLPSCIDRKTYLALPADRRVAYRGVDPRYERLPWVSRILYGLFAVCLCLYIAMEVSPAFADACNRTVGAAMRATLAALTSWIPFSVGEALLLLLPLILFLVLRHALRRRCDTWRTAAVFVGMLLSVVSLLFSLFVLTFAGGYRGRTLADKMDLDTDGITGNELYDTAAYLVDGINRETEYISFYTDDFSIMPYDMDTLRDKVSEAIVRLHEETGLLQGFASSAKPVMISEVMSHMGITGVYSFFTGEANINVNFPDYTLPFTMAHEMAHQRGVAREDEANFIAYLVCIHSDDPYVRYSGYLSAYEYVAPALRRTDSDKYMKIYGSLNDEVKGELAAYSRFYDPYRGSTVGQISSTVNNAYLQSQGTSGVISYNEVVRLIVGERRTDTSANE